MNTQMQYQIKCACGRMKDFEAVWCRECTLALKKKPVKALKEKRKWGKSQPSSHS